ncbi:MAG: UvrD-helicase domain-containing protein [Desulfovibrio sp.]|jgi:uncharacterized protein (TIGR00375 family)|nr:UvrD-helicase domain-containing protein [Desulfovibrio sp.]
MNRFRADLHIHSRYSRATSKKLTPPLLAAWARVKGLHVLGSGDITHGAWRKELKEFLAFDDASGLYRLADPRAADAALPEYAGKAGATPLFMLQGEISSIYKRAGVVRKVHNLVYLPDFETAEKFSLKLARVGNLESDGRPILGLDSRNLLEIVLETHPRAFLIPAHIWTPWFSLFGSRSGFDDIRECFGDLAPEIFALETGLSSDPEMNRLLSALDGYALVSNSDAHSGENLGREANLFSGHPSYDGIHRALKGLSADAVFDGTLEFYPEEGKYHLDGHRKCNIVTSPQETRACGGICPVCSAPLTVGVLSRVLELADRQTPVYNGLAPGRSFSSLIPLAEIIAEIFSCGDKTRKVEALYAKITEKFGSELDVLQSVPAADIARFMPPLGEGIDRMRKGQVTREGGYDGEYGVIRLFSDREKRAFRYGGPALGTLSPKPAPIAPIAPLLPDVAPALPTAAASKETSRLNEAQARAARAGPGPVLVLAGPGTGKTRTLVERAAHLLDRGISPRNILAVTFTRRAAGELEERLAAITGNARAAPRSDTLHALAFELWQSVHDKAPTLLDEEGAIRVFAGANSAIPPGLAREAWFGVALCREKREEPQGDAAAMHTAYIRQKKVWNLADYTDLLEFWLERVQGGFFAAPWTEILVDEIQDLSTLQLSLVRALLPDDGRGFFGIGDPDQSIYAFRGACADARAFLRAAWPTLESIPLRENYRSGRHILHVASTVLGEASAPLVAAKQRAEAETRPHLFEANTAEEESGWIAARVRALIGGSSLTLRNEDTVSGAGTYSPGDIAVLVRMRALAPLLHKALARAGIPVSAPESEGFWMDERVARIIREAGRMLGVFDGGAGDGPPCPDRVLAQGPVAVAAHFEGQEFFDALFRQSSAFKALSRAYKEHGGWQGLLNWVNLQNELELVKSRSEQVQIMSLHAAKGLEFRSVFLPALEEGILPYSSAVVFGGAAADEDDLNAAEERRLFYVGLTRAQESLFLSRAKSRRIFGRELRLKPSRYLADLPAGVVRRSALIARTKKAETHLRLMY